MKFWRKISAEDGTDQNSRFPGALADDYFHVDETSFEDQLALAARFARRLRFFDTAVAEGLESRSDLLRSADGTWEDLFATDELAIMADILSTDVAGLRQSLLAAMDRGVRESIGFIWELVLIIQRWSHRLGALDRPAAQALHAKIEEVVQQRLADELSQLQEYVKVVRTSGGESWQWVMDSMEETWRGRPGTHVSVPAKGSPGFSRWEGRFLESCGDSFVHAVAYIQSIVPPYWEESFRAQTHNPALALFVAFLQASGRAKQSLNTLTARHRDFYYRELLKAKPRQPASDSAWLVLRADAATKPIVVPDGTVLASGKDELGRAVLFESSERIAVTDARVRDVRTFWLERDPMISPERELGYVTRIRTHRFPFVEGREAVWPVFGAESKEGVKGAAEDAGIGFAIASPVLLLREGRRTLTVDLELVDGDAVETAASLKATGMSSSVADVSQSEMEEALSTAFNRYLQQVRQSYWTNSERNLDRLASQMASNVAARMRDDKIDHWRNLYDIFLMEMLEDAASVESFEAAFGRIFRRYLLSRPGAATLDRKRILSLAEKIMAHESHASSLQLIRELLAESHHVLFGRFLRDAFRVALTGPKGWHVAETYSTVPLPDSVVGGQLGMRIQIQLDPEAEPVVPCEPAVHGSAWNTDLPLIRFRLHTQSAFCHYSLFEGLTLLEATLECRVSGVKTVVAFNNEGQIDPSKPFHPFGALPTKGSYFVIGQPEVARKQVSELRLHVEWGGLPPGYGGFQAHYSGYGAPAGTGDFEVSVAGLRDGAWYPGEIAKRSRLKVFNELAGGVVGSAVTLKLDAVRNLTPIPFSTPDTEFIYDLRARSGFINITLESPEEAFGHKDYSASIARVLTANVKSKRPRPLPNAPYTPVIERLTIDYVARDAITASSDRTEGTVTGEQIYEIHPFGVLSVYPSTRGAVPHLLPIHACDGNVLVGIDAKELKGRLTLLFHMAEDSARLSRKGRNLGEQRVSPVQWFYLASDNWRPMAPARVLSDTTHGFLRTGIVTLDIPPDITKTSTVTPSGLFWLGAGASGSLEGFASLYAVYAQGIQAERRTGADNEFTGSHFPEGTIRQVGAAAVGLTDVRHVGSSFGGRPRETDRQLYTRVSERLRHKNRASVPWDYERLVLENFPNVFKVKCLPNVVADSRDPRPGQVMVVVVPAAREGNLRPRFDAVDLEQIQDYLHKVASRSVSISVRNPNYERLQIRCSVRFKRPEAPGQQVAQLNAEIINLLSPWVAGGFQARFGWCIRTEDVQSFVSSLDFVDYVTAFSILHVTDDGEKSYELADTARFWPLTMSSFEEFSLFARSIRAAADPVGVHLRERLGPSTLRLLQDWDGSSDVPRLAAETLLSDINRIAAGSLYNERLFRGVRLKEDTLRLLNADPRQENRLALNRYLLEDWAAGVFAACPARVQEVRPEYPWSIAVPMESHWIEVLDSKSRAAAKPAGIAGLQIAANFIIS